MRSKIRTLSTAVSKSTTFIAALAALAGLGTSSAGCIVDTADDSAFSFDWSVSFVGESATTCQDVGGHTVELESTNLTTGAMFLDTFVCSSRNGVSRVLPVADYSVVARLKDTAGKIISETAPIGERIDRFGLTDLGTVLFEIQTFTLDWAIERGPAAAPVLITCQQAAATTVQLETQLAGFPAQRYDFDCNSPGGGRTTPISLGTYLITVRLLGAQGNVLSATDPMAFTVTGAAPADLGTVILAVN